MSEIKVNTDDLRRNASTFKAEADNLNTALAELLAVLNSIDLGKYQSQLSNQVRSRVMPTQEVISSYQLRLQELAEKLNNKASEFEQANIASVNDVTLLANQMYDLTNSSSIMSASATLRMINNPLSQSIWGWGGNIFGGISNWITGLFIGGQETLAPGINSKSLFSQTRLLYNESITSQNKNNDLGRKIKPKAVYLTPGVTPKGDEQCVEYVKRRREDLKGSVGSAYKYKDRDGVFQVDKDHKNLEEIIAVGYAIIWDRDPNAETVISGTTGANKEHGHVAIVEEVLEDKITVSHANWPPSPKVMTITELRQNYIYILP